jgi:hypothetical protein
MNEEELLNSVPEPKEILGVQISVAEIQEKIALLATLPTEDLKGAMSELKLALRANPEACNLMLPEEIGAMVAALYKTTNQKIMEVKTKDLVKASAKMVKSVDLSKVDLNKLADF